MFTWRATGPGAHAAAGGCAAPRNKRGGPRKHAWQVPAPSSALLPRLAKLGALAMAARVRAGGGVVLTGGGYWGLIALLGVMLALLSDAGQPVAAGVGLRVTGVDAGALLRAGVGGASWALSMAVPAQAYNQLRGGARGVGHSWRDKPWPGSFTSPPSARPGLWLLASMVIVADYWGGTPARWILVVAALLALGGLWSVQLIDDAFAAAQHGLAGAQASAPAAAGLVLVMAGSPCWRRRQALTHDRAATWKEDCKPRTPIGAGLRLMHGP